MGIRITTGAALALVICFTVATCSSSPNSPARVTPGSTTSSSTDSMPAEVREQLDPGDSAALVVPGVWVRKSDALLLGECDVVKPWAATHGKPGGFICW